MAAQFEWDEAKNKVLKKRRQISFNQIAKAIQKGDLIASLPHYNQKRYPNQKLYLVKWHDYIYVVPYIQNKETSFLKTVFASRKYTKKLLKRRNK